MTKKPLPQEGGSYVRNANGTLRQASAKPADGDKKPADKPDTKEGKS